MKRFISFIFVFIFMISSMNIHPVYAEQSSSEGSLIKLTRNIDSSKFKKDDEVNVRYTITPKDIKVNNNENNKKKEIVLVIDTSGSMDDKISSKKKIDIGKEAAKRFVNKFENDDNVSIALVEYNDLANTLNDFNGSFEDEFLTKNNISRICDYLGIDLNNKIYMRYFNAQSRRYGYNKYKNYLKNNNKNFNYYEDEFYIKVRGSYIPVSYKSDLMRAFNINGSNSLSEIIDSLRADGGTNTGDGLRQAYYMLQNDNDADKYIVLLTDGNPEAYSVNRNDKFKMDSGEAYWYYSTTYRGSNIINDYREDSVLYAKKIVEEKISKSDIKTFIIGIDDGANTTNKELASLANGSYYNAFTRTAVNDIYNQIATNIKTGIFANMNFEESIPNGLEVIKETDGLHLKGENTQWLEFHNDIINGNINNISYALNSDETYYEAEPITFSIKFKVLDSCVLGENESSFVNYFVDDLHEKKYFKEIEIDIDSQIVSSYPNITIKVSDAMGVKEPIYEANTDEQESRVDRFFDEEIVLKGDAYADFNINGIDLTSAKYKILKQEIKPQNMPTSGWNNIDITEEESDINKDVMYDKNGYLKWRSYDVSHLPTVSDKTSWEKRSEVYKNPHSSIGLKPADIAKNHNEYVSIEWQGNNPVNYITHTVFYDYLKMYEVNGYQNYKEASKFWGYIQVPEDGTYYFGINSDDGSKGYIIDESGEKQQIVDQFNVQGSTFRTDNNPIVLKKNILYPIYLEYFNWGGDGQFRLFYNRGNRLQVNSTKEGAETPNNATEVPANWFYPSKTNSPGEIAEATFEGNASKGIELPRASGKYYIAVRAKNENGDIREGFYGPFRVDGKSPLVLNRSIEGDKDAITVGSEFEVNYIITPEDIPMRDLADTDIKEKKIIMVIDTSTSMNMEENKIYIGDERKLRIDVARDAAISFIEKFENTPGVSIAVVKYYGDSEKVTSGFVSNYDKNTNGTYSKNNNFDDLKSKIRNNITSNKCHAGTNTGEGLRKAYYLFDDEVSDEIDKYIVLLSDGEDTIFRGSNNSRNHTKVKFDENSEASNLRYVLGDNINDSGNYYLIKNASNSYYKKNYYDTYNSYYYELVDYSAAKYTELMANKIHTENPEINMSFIAFSDDVNAERMSNLAKSVAGKSYSALDGDALNKIYSDIADEIKSNYVVKNIKLSESLPEGISLSSDNYNSIDKYGQKFSMDVNNICYILNKEEKVYRAEPVEFSIKLKADKAGKYKLGGNNKSLITYTDVDELDRQAAFPEIEFEIIDRLSAPITLIKETPNGKNEAIENRKFDLKYTIKPEVIKKDDIKLSFHGNVPDKFTIKNIKFEEIFKDDFNNFDIKGLNNIKRETVKINDIEYGLKISGEIPDIEYILNNSTGMYEVKDGIYPNFRITLKANNAGNYVLGDEEHSSFISYKDIDEDETEKTKAFKEISIKVKENKAPINVERNLLNDSKEIKSGEVFEVEYNIKPYDIELLDYFTEEQVKVIERDGINAVDENGEKLISGFEVSNISFKEHIPDNIEVVYIDGANDKETSTNNITATFNDFEYTLTEYKDEAGNKKMKLSANEISFKIKYKALKDGYYNLGENDTTIITYIDFDDDKTTKPFDILGLSIGKTEENETKLNIAHVRLSSVEDKPDKYKFEIKITEGTDGAGKNIDLKELVIDNNNDNSEDNIEVDVRKCTNDNGVKIYEVEVDESFLVNTCITIEANDKNNNKDTANVPFIKIIDQDKLKKGKNSIKLETEINSELSVFNVNGTEYITDNLNLESGKHEQHDIVLNEGDNSFEAQVSNKEGNICELNTNLLIEDEPSNIIKYGLFVNNQKASNCLQSEVKNASEFVSANVVNTFKQSIGLILEVNRTAVNININVDTEKMVENQKSKLKIYEVNNEQLELTSVQGYKGDDQYSFDEINLVINKFPFEKGKTYIIVYDFIPDGNVGFAPDTDSDGIKEKITDTAINSVKVDDGKPLQLQLIIEPLPILE